MLPNALKTLGAATSLRQLAPKYQPHISTAATAFFCRKYTINRSWVSPRSSFLKERGGKRPYSQESFFESRMGKTVVLVVGSAVCIGVFAYQGYMFFFGPGSVYPAEVRKLLREGASTYLQDSSKQDLNASAKCYKEALDLLDTKYSMQKDLEPSSPYVTGILARLAEVYLKAQDKPSAIYYFKNLISRVFTKEELLDHKLVVAKLANQELDKKSIENIMRGIGAMNRLAETYEIIGDVNASTAPALSPSNYKNIQEYKNADDIYTWVLNVVMESYNSHYRNVYVDTENDSNGSSKLTTPDFDSKTLPKYLSAYMVNTLFFNASNFYSKVGLYGLSTPLLLRASDLLDKSKKSQSEENVCKSCVILTHLVKIATENNDLEAAKKWIVRGKDQAKLFIQNESCLQSLVALVFADGYIKEQENKLIDARIEYRKALELSKAMAYEEGETNASESIARISLILK
ncbi:hypothetical protein BB561_002071 [Smittium simulii]|uniref:Uncharacterized protein n=1 Tax=Smittium simulii TaxID=133385 RepID=A0A2T9YRZ3_9FUNG|nr:hypothetical protein BB561_002071 [Smittium simulii]